MDTKGLGRIPPPIGELHFTLSRSPASAFATLLFRLRYAALPCRLHPCLTALYTRSAPGPLLCLNFLHFLLNFLHEPADSTRMLTESNCQPYVDALINDGGTPMFVSRYTHAFDYEGEIVACLEWSAAHALLATLRASATGAEVFDICEA